MIQSQYPDINQTSLVGYDKMFEIRPATHYANKHYHFRNVILAEMISNYEPKKIFEFAAGSYDLAQLIITTNPQLKYYRWSDWSQECLNQCKEVLEQYDVCKLMRIDICKKYWKVKWSAFDCIVSVSVEHLENDLDIIRSMPSGTRFFFGVPNFDDPQHFRFFESESDIELRFSGLLDIFEIKVYEYRNIYKKFMISSVRK